MKQRFHGEQLEYLRKRYSDPKVSKSELLDEFKCSWRAIVNCANNHGIKRGLDIEYIIEQAKSGRSPSAVSDELDVSKKVILDIYENHGFERTRKTFKLPADEIIRKYKDEKISPSVMCKEYGCTPAPIYRILKKHGIEANTDRDYLDTLENENLFEVIDTEAKAYLLGLLAADGCLHKSKSGGYHVRLALIDEELVRHAARLMGWKGAFSYKPPRWVTFKGKKHWCKAVWGFSIGSKKMVSDIVKHGVGFDKSQKMSFPSIDVSLQRHFIRGFFDGDGCVTFTDDAKNWFMVPHVSIIGLEPILQDIQNILITDAGVSKTQLVKEKRVTKVNLYNLHYRGEYAIAIRDYMYKDATVYLQRKYDKLFSVEIPEYAHRRKWRKDGVFDLLNQDGYTVEEYCNTYGFGDRNVRRWLYNGLMPHAMKYGRSFIPKKEADDFACYLNSTLSMEDAASLLGVSLNWLYQLTCRGTVQRSEKEKIRNRISIAEIERVKLLERGTRHTYTPCRTPKKHEVAGLFYSTPTDRWTARITINNKKVFLGSYKEKSNAVELINKVNSLGDLSAENIRKTIDDFNLAVRGKIDPKNRDYRPFQEVRLFVRALGLQSRKEWFDYCKSGSKPHDIPKSLSDYYKGEFVSWGDVLGTNYVAPQRRSYRLFEEARKFAQALCLKNREEWKEYCKSGDKPEDIPSHPTHYKKWTYWGDFLGSGESPRNVEYLSFHEARAIVRTHCFRTGDDWKLFAKSKDRPVNIPSNPRYVYSKEFVSMSDWIGSDYIPTTKRVYRDIESAKLYVHSLNLKNQHEYRELSKQGKLPQDIPGTPQGVYQNKGWQGWIDYLGYEVKTFLDFNNARKWSRTSGIKSRRQWHDLWKSGKLPKGMPAQPDQIYKEFATWFDWLGKEAEAESFVWENGVRVIPQWEEKKKFILEHADGWSNQEFANHFNIDAAKMVTWRKKVEKEIGRPLLFNNKMCSGSEQPSAKLNENDVRLIRQRSANGESSVVLAKEYGVSKTTINGIKNNTKWKHVGATC